MGKGKCASLGVIIDRFATVFLTLVLLIQVPYFLSNLLMQDDFEGTLLPFNPPTVIGVVLFLPLFYSLVRITVLFDETLRNEFYERTDPIRTFTDRCKFFVCRVRFWGEAAAFALLYWILPLKWFCMPLVRQFTDGTPDFKDKAILFIILLPILLALNIRARLTAMNFWQTTRHIIRESKFDYSEKGLKKQLFTCCVVYGVGNSLLSMFTLFAYFFLLPLLEEILESVNLYAVLIAAILLTVLWIAAITLRALVKRHSFLKKLKTVCAAKGYTVSKISRPYLSVWLFGEGESFSVEANGKRYSCKLLGSLQRMVRTILFADGQGCFSHSIRLFRRELFRYESWFTFSYSTEDRKILIINPIPKHVYLQIQGKLHPLDNGDHVGEFTMYTASAFLNALERESIV